MGPLSEAAVSDSIRQLGEKSGKTKDNRALTFRAEAMAFAFTPDYPNERTGWGTYYGPMLVFGNERGEITESPSIQMVTPEMLEYWEKRSATAKHPVLSCRYADLVWDFSKRIAGHGPSIAMAHFVIEASIEIARSDLAEHQVETVRKLERALSLALSISDSSRMEQVRDEMILYEEKISEDDKPGWWGFSYDNLIDNKKVRLTKDQEKRIIVDLEERLARLCKSDGTTEANHHAAEQAAVRLAKYYRKTSRQEDVRRVLLLWGGAVEAAASSAAAMVGSSWLKQVYDTYYANGMKSDADRLDDLIRELGQKAVGEMQTISTEISIPSDRLEQFTDEITAGPLHDALTRIAWQFLPMHERTVQEIHEQAKKTPLQSLFRQVIQDPDGHPVAEIGPLAEDLEGHIARHISHSMRFDSVLLRKALEVLQKRHGAFTDGVLEYLYESPVFSPHQKTLLAAGLEALASNNQTAAAHILVPQIEGSLRSLLQLIGGPIYQQGRYGGLAKKTLGQILQNAGVEQALGRDTMQYLRIVLVDPRGWNLRNDICHGLATGETFNAVITDRLLHVLLLLAQVRAQARG